MSDLIPLYFLLLPRDKKKQSVHLC